MGIDPSQKMLQILHAEIGELLPLCTGYVIMWTKSYKSGRGLLAVKYGERRGKAEVNDSFNADVRQKVEDGATKSCQLMNEGEKIQAQKLDKRVKYNKIYL